MNDIISIWLDVTQITLIHASIVLKIFNRFALLTIGHKRRLNCRSVKYLYNEDFPLRIVRRTNK